MPTKMISVRIDEDLLKYLQDRAEKEHRTLSNMIVSLLAEQKERGFSKWVHDETDNSVMCDNCGCNLYPNDISSGEVYYCPNCGAKMM